MMIEWLGQFSPLAVDFILCVGIMTILAADLILPPGNKKILGWASLAIMCMSFAATFLLDCDGNAFGGAYMGTAFSTMMKQIFFMSAILSILASINYAERHFTNRQGEFYLLILCSVLGMSLVSGAQNLILLVVCFELMGIPLYVLAAFARNDKLAVEGALKLYLIGAVSSVTVLYGMSLLFGLAGSADIRRSRLHSTYRPRGLDWPHLSPWLRSVLSLGFSVPYVDTRYL